MNVGSICYLPPPNVGHTEAFLENLRRYPSYYPVQFYSEHAWKLPGLIKIESPERVGKKDVWHIPKLCFLEGIRIAQKLGWEYLFILEPDCRVIGKHWDRAIFSEFMLHEQAEYGGTFYAFNIFNHSIDYIRTFGNWAKDYLDLNPPALFIYGENGCCENKTCNVFTNGALSILRTKTVNAFFPELDLARMAVNGAAYDVSVGYGFRSFYGPNMFNKMVPLSTVFSRYGNSIFNEEQRMQLLIKEQVRAVHQIKSDWAGP